MSLSNITEKDVTLCVRSVGRSDSLGAPSPASWFDAVIPASQLESPTPEVRSGCELSRTRHDHGWK